MSDMFKNGEVVRLIAMFENPQLQRHLPYTGGNIQDKAPRDQWRNGTIYNNGALNSQWLVFFAGYSAGKAFSLQRYPSPSGASQ